MGAAGYQKQQAPCLRAALTALLCPALFAGCIIKRAGTELNLCEAHRAEGSCELFSSRSGAAGITSAAAERERKGGTHRTPQERRDPLGASAPRRWTTSAGPGRCGCCCSWRCCPGSGDKVRAGEAHRAPSQQDPPVGAGLLRDGAAGGWGCRGMGPPSSPCPCTFRAGF